MDRIELNFVYTLTLIISRLGLLSIKFRKFATELWPLIDFRISFPLNILRMNQNLTKFCIHIHINKIQLGLSRVIFKMAEFEMK